MADPAPPPRHLYLHLPFCRARCRYCDFPTTLGDAALQEAYVDALLAELARLGVRRPTTIYLGGGTPTALSPVVLERLLAGIRELVRPRSGTEWTAEANPESADAATLDRLAAGGVNRLSLGVQSFDDRRLRFLGRIHDAGRARAAARAARERFGRLSIDLMVGLPGEDGDTVRREVAALAALEADHASCYALTVEAGTPLARAAAAGEPVAADAEGQRASLLAAWQALAEAGFTQYETSNFARLGAACRHNLAGWRRADYAAAGAAAVSTVGRERCTRLRDPAAYIEAVRQGRDPLEYRELLTDTDILAETWMLGLRLVEGVRRDRLIAAGDDEARWLPVAKDLAARGLVTLDDAALALTAEGRLVQDAVTVQLMP